MFASFTLAALLAQAPTPPQPVPPPPPPVALDGGLAQTSETPTALGLQGALEAELQLLPSGPTGGGYDGYTTLRPAFGFKADTVFEIVFAPSFRLRLLDTAPAQRAQDLGGVLRKEDWDALSDFGQVVRLLRIAPDDSPFTLRVGAAHKKSLGLGHVVHRYSNQLNPDYHPAAATLALAVGPTRFEVFISDVLGARLFSGEARWDVGATFMGPSSADRTYLALEVGNDFGRAGLPGLNGGCPLTGCTGFAPATNTNIMNLDVRWVAVRNPSLQWMLFAGIGSRANATNDLGVVLGTSLDAAVKEVALSVKLEGRKVGGGFRYGFFGPTWELSRFSATGLGLVSQVDELLPDSFSLHGEARVRVGPDSSVEVMAEYFGWGRTDVDASINLDFPDQAVTGSLRFTAVGVGLTPRYAATTELRWRIIPSVYLLGSGGTVFFPQVDGSLNRGVTVALGAGIDFER